MVLVLVCVTPSRFQSNSGVNDFTFAPNWFVKTSKLLRELPRFVVG